MDFAAKDALVTGNPSKVVKGTELGAEFDAIQTADALNVKTTALGSGVQAFLATPSSANLRTSLTDETGTGAAVFATSPTITTPTLAGATMTGNLAMSGASIFDANASVAAHATACDPWSLGNYVTLTGGAVTFTALTSAPQAGAEVELYMNAAHVFTDGAVFEVDGDANYTATIGDRVLMRAKSTTVFTVHPRKKDGKAVVETTQTQTIIQVVNATPYTANADLTTTIPLDDTIPTSTEGNEILTANITPADNTNKVLINACGTAATGVTGNLFVVALFRGTTCIFTQASNSAAAAIPEAWSFNYLDSPASAAQQTYSVKIGAAGTLRCNGSLTARFFGGVLACTMQLLEVNA